MPKRMPPQLAARKFRATDSAFWRDLREDFESLPPEQFSVLWSPHLPINFKGEPLQSQWTWWRVPDESLRARLSAIAFKGASALGHNSEDAWFDYLRDADFVKFKLTGDSIEKQPDGSLLETSDGPIDDVVKQSITLCHALEAYGVESLSNGSSRGRRAESGFTKPGPLQPGSPPTVDGSTEEGWSGLDWAAIQISFLSDERVQISKVANTETWNYGELGFADRRTGKPNLAWLTLRAMAEGSGLIRDGAQAGSAWPKVEKRMQQIRRVFQQHFGIDTDPCPFVAGTGYQALFHIDCHPSFFT